MRLRFLFVSPMADIVGSDLAGYLSSFDAEVVHVDWRPEGAEHGEELAERIREAQPCDAVIVAGSHCIGETVKAIRDTLGETPVILGSTDDALCQERTGEDPGADLIFTGPVGALPFALRTFGFRMRKKRVRREEMKSERGEKG